MYRIIKITYAYKDGSTRIEKPPYTSCANKEQLERLRKILKKNFDCESIKFTYEER